MTSGWQEPIPVRLEAPWQDYTVFVWPDPPIGAWMDLQEAAQAAIENPTDIPTLERAVATLGPLVASHDIQDRDGQPLRELSLRSMPGTLFLAVVRAVRRADWKDEGPAPFGSRATSPEPSSPARSRRRGTPSGALPRA